MSALRFFRSSLIAVLLLGLFSTAAFAAPKDTNPRRTPVVPVELPQQAQTRGGVGGTKAATPVAEEPADGEAAPVGETVAEDLRVMSFNMHVGIGTDGVLDLERTAQVIEASGAQVVGLQEVDRFYGSRSNWMDQATWLAERLGMHMVYGANIDLPPLRADQPRRQYGNAVLSAFPIVSSVNHALPNHGTEQRGALDVTLDVNGTAVRVIDTHLTHLGGDELLAQAEAVAGLAGQSASSTVVLGDLNASPGTAAFETIAAALEDAWASQPRKADGFTYPASNPTYRIDYAFASSDVTVSTAAVVDTLASDHRPVLAELSIPR